MNRNEVRSVINDFRRSYRDDLGTKVTLTLTTDTTNEFSIDGGTYKTKDVSDYTNADGTKTLLYGTCAPATKQNIDDYGVNNTSTSVGSLIYEDVVNTLVENGLTLADLVSCKISFATKGGTETYYINSYNADFQLTDTFVFVYLGLNKELS